MAPRDAAAPHGVSVRPSVRPAPDDTSVPVPVTAAVVSPRVVGYATALLVEEAVTSVVLVVLAVTTTPVTVLPRHGATGRPVLDGLGRDGLPHAATRPGVAAATFSDAAPAPVSGLAVLTVAAGQAPAVALVPAITPVYAGADATLPPTTTLGLAAVLATRDTVGRAVLAVTAAPAGAPRPPLLQVVAAHAPMAVGLAPPVPSS